MTHKKKIVQLPLVLVKTECSRSYLFVSFVHMNCDKCLFSRSRASLFNEIGWHCTSTLVLKCIRCPIKIMLPSEIKVDKTQWHCFKRGSLIHLNIRSTLIRSDLWTTSTILKNPFVVTQQFPWKTEFVWNDKQYLCYSTTTVINKTSASISSSFHCIIHSHIHVKAIIYTTFVRFPCHRKDVFFHTHLSNFKLKRGRTSAFTVSSTCNKHAFKLLHQNCVSSKHRQYEYRY